MEFYICSGWKVSTEFIEYLNVEWSALQYIVWRKTFYIFLNMLDFIIQVATLALKYPPHVHTNCCDSKYKTLCLNEHKRSCITKQWRLFIFQTNACQKVVTGTLLFRCYVILILFRSWILLRSCLYLLYWLSEDIRFDAVIIIVKKQRHFF